MIYRIAALAALTAWSGAAPAESFRCGKWLVSEESTVAELVEKCGEPTKKESETIDVYGPSDAGPGTIKRGETTIERWEYDRGSRAFTMIVNIIDGKIKSIEHKP